MNDAVPITEELIVELFAPVAHDFVFLVVVVVVLGVGLGEGGERWPLFCYGTQGEVLFATRWGETGNVLIPV